MAVVCLAGDAMKIPDQGPFKMELLRNRPDCVDACAAWSFGRWGGQKQGESFDAARSFFHSTLNKDTLPLTRIIINTDTAQPVAMGGLWIHDGALSGSPPPPGSRLCLFYIVIDPRALADG